MKMVGRVIRRRPDRLSEDKCSETRIDWSVDWALEADREQAPTSNRTQRTTEYTAPNPSQKASPSAGNEEGGVADI